MWGFGAADGVLAVILGLGAPAAAIAWWAMLGAPKAPWSTRGVARFFVELAFFGAGALAWALATGWPFGVAFALLVCLDTALLRRGA